MDIKKIMTGGCALLFCTALTAQMASAQEASVEKATTRSTSHASDSLPRQWTLQQCIDYALAHNIGLKKSRLNVKSCEVDVKTAHAALFPSLNASIGQRIVNRPNSETNTIINGDNITSSQSKTSYNGSYGIDANWTLYNGGKRLNTLEQQKLNTRIAELEMDTEAKTIQESILQTFVQILYAHEAVNINEQTLNTSQAVAERGRQLLEAGSISRADLAQLEAQVSNDQYNLVAAQATLDNYNLQLKQILELDGEAPISLQLPQIENLDIITPLPGRTDVYRAALLMRPEIESGQLNIDASELEIKKARSGYLPTLSLSAGIGTSNANGSDFSFGEQIKTNWNNSIGLTLSIPLYDNRQTKSAIQKAKIQRETNALALAEQQKALYKTIEGYWLEANSAQKKYAAANSNLQSTRESFNLLQEQFNLGMKNTVDLLTEKNNLLNAQQELLQAKYMALLNSRMLTFYQQGTITVE